MNFWAKSDKGIVRSQNQDVCFNIELKQQGFMLAGVCDGMGGAKAGNVASELAAKTFTSTVTDRLKGDFSLPDIEKALLEAVKRANDNVFSQSVSVPELNGMGTTLVAAAVIGNIAVIVNVGDSRAYRVSRKYGIKQLTRDHSVVADLVERGDITRAEAFNHPNKNLITRALGTEPVIKPDVFYLEVEQGDILLLCSDGLTNTVDDQEFVYELLKTSELSIAGESLIALALKRGAPDNVTVNLLQI